MPTNDQDHIEKLWKNYAESELSTLLLYDTWHWRTALPILCNIKTFETNLGDDLIAAIDYEAPPPLPSGSRLSSPMLISSLLPLGGYINLTLFSDGSLEPLPIQESLSRTSEYSLIDKLAKIRGISRQRTDLKDTYSELKKEVRTRTRANYHAFLLLKQAVPIFRSNPDHTDTENFSPEYFIRWANNKNIPIAWLDWAIHHDLVNETTTETLVAEDAEHRVKPSDVRREEGLTAAKMILRQKHNNGKLSERAEFNEYMKKSAVINFIRKRSGDFPECAKTKQYPNRRTIKDQEPTLTKNFPDFTKDPDILAEYERLTGKK